MRRTLYIPFGYMIVSIVTAMLVMIDAGCPDKYANLFILPCFFAFISLLFCNMLAYSTNNLVVLIVTATYFVKNVLAVLFLYFGDYYSLISDFTKIEVNKAIGLMMLEVFCVFLFLYIKHKSIVIEDGNEQKKDFVEDGEYTTSAKMVLLIIFLLLVAMWFIEPAISNNYISIFNEDVSTFSSKIVNESLSRGTIGRICLTVFLMAFSIFRIIYSIIILKWIRNAIRPVTAAIIVSYLVIFIQLFFITSETAEVILIICLMITVISKLYQDETKMITLTSVIFGVIGVAMVFIGKSSESLTLAERVSSLFQSYFPGVSNLAGVFNVYEYEKLPHIISDFYSMIPFRNTLFTYEPALKTVEVYTYYNNASGSIIPFIGELYLYVGYLAPLAIVFIIQCAFWFYKKMKDAETLMEYIVYLYITIFFAISPVMYHITILGQRFFSTFVPLIIICVFLKNRRNKIV